MARQAEGQTFGYVLTAVAATIVAAAGDQPVLSMLSDLHSFWTSTTAACAPMYAWRELLAALGLPVKEIHSFAGGLLGILIGLPLLVVGALLLEALWFVPYLVLLVLIALAKASAASHVLIPGVIAAVAWTCSARLRAWIRPRTAPRTTPFQPTPARATPGAEPLTMASTAPLPLRRRVSTPAPAALCRIDNRCLEMRGRVDPYTRTPFAPGELFVRCGACHRAYKLATCEEFSFRCPIDGSPLDVRAD